MAHENDSQQRIPSSDDEVLGSKNVANASVHGFEPARPSPDAIDWEELHARHGVSDEIITLSRKIFGTNKELFQRLALGDEAGSSRESRLSGDSGQE